jgi:hypothetical protein
MNKIKVFAVIIMVSISLIAKSQSNNSSYPKTLFNGNSNIVHGGYGAFSMKYKQMDDKSTLLIGGRGGWIANHKFSVGLAGYGIVSDQFKLPESTFNSYFTGGYGGAYVEAILFSNQLINLSIPFECGGGELVRIDNKNDNSYVSFLYAEPSVELDLNVAKGFKMSLGTYYMLKGKIGSTNTLNSNIINGFSVGVQFKWGLF